MVDLYDVRDTVCMVFVRSRRVFAMHVGIEGRSYS